MKKILICMMGILLLLGLCACGDEPETAVTAETTSDQTQQTAQTQEQPAKDEQTEETVDLTQVRTAILEQLQIADSLPLETEALMDLYGISADQVAQSGCFVTMSGTFPDEILLVEAVDDAAADMVQESLQKRLDEVLVQSQTYDPENYAAAQACQILRSGTYVALILSPRQADMVAIYQSFVD